MDKESLETKAPLFEDCSSLNASLLTFDLPTLMEKMKAELIRVKGEPTSMILLKSPDKQIVIIAIHEETEIKSFQSNDSVTFQIIEGEVKFHTRKATLILEKGQFLTLHEKIKYSLITKGETVLLLTIASGILQ